MGEFSVLGGCCCFVITLVSVIMFIVSFKVVTPLEASLLQNTISKDVGEEVYISGRYYVGLTNTFITYPTTLHNVNFASGSLDYGVVAASTSDGQQISLEVSFQYRLRVAELSLLYAKYELNYHTQYVTQAVQVIKNLVATTYDTTDFFEIREFIGEAMHVSLNAELWEEYCVVEHFQLREVTPPTATDTSILNKIIERQNINIAEVEQETALIVADTDRLVAAAEAEVVVVIAEAEKQGQLIIGNAVASEITIHLNGTANAYAYLKEELNYDSGELLQHMLYEHIRTLDSAKSSITVDFPSALISV